jgi:NADPH-dependent glutamate synthase beta subunit-like oxidoreductase
MTKSFMRWVPNLIAKWASPVKICRAVPQPRHLSGWYNGHPDYRDAQFDLTTKRVVVIGNGNVAMDVTRALMASVDELATTDMADHALAALRQSQVTQVVMLGRRSPGAGGFYDSRAQRIW